MQPGLLKPLVSLQKEIRRAVVGPSFWPRGDALRTEWRAIGMPCVPHLQALLRESHLGGSVDESDVEDDDGPLPRPMRRPPVTSKESALNTLGARSRSVAKLLAIKRQAKALAAAGGAALGGQDHQPPPTTPSTAGGVSSVYVTAAPAPSQQLLTRRASQVPDRHRHGRHGRYLGDEVRCGP